MPSMNSSSALRTSDRIYRSLLQLYPAGFRARFANEMAQVFHDACAEAYRRHGRLALAARWLETIPDFTVSVIDEHSQENFQMAQTTLVRALGMAGLVGGALWVAAGVILIMGGAVGEVWAPFSELRSLLVLAMG